MIVIPALDLREGACVQLVGGRYEEERVRLDDPLAAARSWASLGFRRLHLVDLDAATGRGSNDAVTRKILAEPGLDVQVGGGVRDAEKIQALLDAGAKRVVVGTRAIEDPDWLAAMAGRFPDRLIVAADVSGRSVLTRGWQIEAGREIFATLASLDPHPLAGVLVTAVDREGRLSGTDLELMREIVVRSRLPLHVAGGIHRMDELRTLVGFGVHAAIVGMALYPGALDPRELVEEFAS
jgi:phosphoribosylformimino-5-aminoimidazole carboxamide ribotide isomerase